MASYHTFIHSLLTLFSVYPYTGKIPRSVETVKVDMLIIILVVAKQ